MIEKAYNSDVKKIKDIFSLDTFRKILKSEKIPSTIHIHDSRLLSIVDINYWKMKVNLTDSLYFHLKTNDNETIGSSHFLASENYSNDSVYTFLKVTQKVAIRTNLGLKAPKGILGRIFLDQKIVDFPYLGTFTEDALVLWVEEKEKKIENYELVLSYLFPSDRFKVFQEEDDITLFVQDLQNNWEEKTLYDIINKLINTKNETVRCIISDKSILEIQSEWLATIQNTVSIDINNRVSVDTTIEKELLKIFRYLLDNDDVQINDNFFEIGGNSLLAVQLISRIHKVLEVKLTFKELFKNPVITDLARLISLKDRVDYLSIDKLPEQEYYELSSAQLRLWVLSQTKEISIAYNEFNAMKISGAIDVKLFNIAVQKLIDRYEILRTSFVSVQGDPKQLIHPAKEARMQVEVHDFMQRNEKDINDVLLKESRFNFNLEKDTLIRVQLFKTQKLEHIMTINMHHIISDGWSQVVLFNELMMTYYELVNDLDVTLKFLPIQYKDYANWHNDILQTDKVDLFKKYWNTKFAVLPPKVDLTAFQKRKPQMSFRGKVKRYKLDDKYFLGFKVLAQKTQTTMFSVVLTYFKVLLYKYSGQKDITIGTSVAGRNHPDLESQIGFYVNTIPVRNTINSENNFIQQLHELSNNLLNDFDHDIYPFESLVADLILANDEVGTNPLFDVFIEYFNYSDRFITEEKIIGEKKLKIASLAQDNETSIFGLNIMFIESNENISIEVRYDTEQFEERKIDSLIEHFTLLIDKINNRPEQKIKSFEILLPNELKKLEEFAETEKELPINTTVLDLIEKHVKETPNDIAITYEDDHMTYEELWKFSNKIANFLEEQYEGKQYKVGVLMDRSCYTLAAVIGAWKAGAIYIPLDPKFPSERLKYIINSSETCLLFSDKVNIKEANRLQWECDSLKSITVLDAHDILGLVEAENKQMNVELWEYFGDKAHDDITGGGWFNSYNGEAFSREEMNEYRDNAVDKLIPYLNKEKNVLEIGCASGITMFALADRVKSYVGIDLNQVILNKNQDICDKEEITNIKMYPSFAHEIDQLEEGDFDIIIINSVIQNFNGHNYLREVLDKSIEKLNVNGIIFLGDLIDQDKKSDLIEDLKAYKRENPDALTKLEWDEELFVSKSFLENYVHSKDIQIKIIYSDKRGQIENELKKFRFDAILKVNKEKVKENLNIETVKHQFDLSHIELQNDDNYPNLVTPNDISYIIYTSGSTGKPKGVIVEHLGMLNHLDAKKNDFKLNKQSKIVQNASQCFDVSIWQYVNALLVGGQTFVYSNEVVMEPEILLTKLKEDQITIFEVVPSYMQILLDSEERRTDRPMSSLIYYLVNGETLKPSLARKWFEHYSEIPLVNCYGPTEASDDVTHYFINEKPDLDLRVPIGNTPIQNFRFHFLDNDFNRVPIGAKGEICVSGIGVGRGYVNDLEKTKKSFMKDPFFPNRKMYKTGDIGKVLEDGTIEFFGRKDTQVKIRGYRIELEEIEIAITKNEGVINATVLVGQDTSGLNYLYAFVTKSDEELTTDKIKEQIKLELPDYMIPNVIRFLKEFPLNHNGKTDKNVMKQMMTDQVNINPSHFVAPIGDLEETIAKVWEKVIGINSIGRNDNFFELGGHSISAIQSVRKIKNEYGINLPLKDFFEYPTVKKLAEIIESYKKESNGLSIPAISKKKIKSKYKISPVQYAEWYLQKLNANSTFYNVGFILEFMGRIDAKAFKETISRLVNRHDIFKFTIVEENGIPYQVLKEEPCINLDDIMVDYSHLKEDEINLQEIIYPYFNTIFDFTKSIVNIKLIKINNDRHIFIFETHHIIWDQISTFNFYREFIKTYNSIYQGNEIILPELKVDYSDYTEWINKLIDEGKLEKQRKYWLDKYKKLPETLELPTDYPRPLIHSFNGDFISEPIGLEFKNEILSFCNKNEITYQIFLISVLNLLLYRLTNQKDFVVGTPIWNRDEEHLDKVLGLFASGIPIRCTIEQNWSFQDLLLHIKNNSLEAYENHMYPFNKIIEELNPATDFSRQKIISVFFGVQNDETELQNIDLKGIEVKEVSQELDMDINSTSVFDFTLQVDHNQDDMYLTLRYNNDLFKKETANNFLKRFRKLVKQTLTDPSTKLLDYSFLVEEEENLIKKVSVSPVKFEIPNVGLHNIVNSTASKYSDKIAVIEEKKTITYVELSKYINQIAHLVLELGVQKQDRVGILLPKSIDFIASVLGILNTGAIFVPLSCDYPEQRVQEIINQSGIKKIITINNFFNNEFLNSSFADSLVMLDTIDFDKISTDSLNIPVSKEDLIYTIFTSGSTGKPKGIDIKHAGVINIIQSTIEDFNFTVDEKVLFHTATVFDASIMDYLWPLVAGASIVVMPDNMKNNLSNYEKLINEHQITHIQSVPLLLESLVDAVERKELTQLASLKRVVVGGAILNTTLSNRFLNEFGIDLYNCYGPTETTVDSTRHKCFISNVDSQNFSPIGKPVANTKLYVLDENLKQVPIGVPGELYIASVGASKGYLNDEVKTNKAFIKNPFDDDICSLLYKTGDNVALLHNGDYVLYGRLDNQVKLNGNRIEIEEIESLLLNYDGIYNGAVILNKKGAYEQLVAYIEPEKDVNIFFTQEKRKYRVISLKEDISLKVELNLLIKQYSKIDEDISLRYQDVIYQFPEFQLGLFYEGELVGAVISCPVFLENFEKTQKIDLKNLLEKGEESNAFLVLELIKKDTHNLELKIKEVSGLYQKTINQANKQYVIENYSQGVLEASQNNSDVYHLNKTLTKEEVEKHLSNYLPQYMIPKNIIIRDRIDLNINGKVDKNVLKKINITSQFNDDVQLSPIHEKVKEIFINILKIDSISSHDSFFQLGGHSINMIQLIAKIENEFDVKIPIHDVFNNQTFYEIGSYIKKFQNGTNKEKIYLQQLSSGGNKNIFCFPSISTSAADFIELAKQLKEYNVYAFDFSLLDQYSDMHKQKNEIIQNCKKMILDSTGDNTFHLLGYSAGSHIAYELLKEVEIQNLADKFYILDMESPIQIETADKMESYKDAEVDEFLSLNKLEEFNDIEKEQIISRVLKYAELASSIKGYKVIDTPFYVFSSEDANRKKQQSWKELSKREVIFKDLKGSHYSILKSEFINKNSEILKLNN